MVRINIRSRPFVRRLVRRRRRRRSLRRSPFRPAAAVLPCVIFIMAYLWSERRLRCQLFFLVRRVVVRAAKKVASPSQHAEWIHLLAAISLKYKSRVQARLTERRSRHANPSSTGINCMYEGCTSISCCAWLPRNEPLPFLNLILNKY